MEALFKVGVMPQELDELQGDIEITPGVASSYLNKGDVYYCLGCGGGGYGDPLERDPELVLRDIHNGVVSREWAKRICGVALNKKTTAVNAKATIVRRQAILKERQKSAAAPISFHQPLSARPTGEILNSYLKIVHSKEGDFIQCRCGYVLCLTSENYKARAATAIRPWPKAGPYLMNLVQQPRFHLREFYCPKCYTLLDIDIPAD